MKHREYSNGEITIIWRPELCTGLGYCVHTLPQVYQVGEKPWVKIENATTQELIEQIKKCTSGALTYKFVDKSE